MSIEYMQPITIPEYKEQADDIGWEYKKEMTSPGDGASVIIPTTVRNISITLEIDSGSANFEATTSPIAEVLAEDASVVWIPWDNGEVAFTVQDQMVPPTAVRQVNVSGVSRLLLRAQ